MSGRLRWVNVIMVALLLAGCAAPIPREDVPADWSLNVHQPGEWWTQPLIPRSVIVQRCPPPRFWSSDPDLTQETALPPGSSVNYYHWTDDYHCMIGWSEPTSSLESPVGASELETEPVLRRVCSTSGLPMDISWRFVGATTRQRFDERESLAVFIDRYDTVAACFARNDSAWIELAVGADLTAGPAEPACPVAARDLSATEDETVDTYTLMGAGAVRDAGGRVLKRAKTLRIGLAEDSVTTSHSVVDGIAIVAAEVTPRAAVKLDWDHVPAVEGQVLDATGKVLATCRT